MPTKPQDCVNYRTNEQQCPCPQTDCDLRAICCECIQAHASKDNKTFCMRDTERPAATRTLPIGQNPDCANRAPNDEFCPCGEVSCDRHGLCCDCIRFHWGHKVWPKVGCMG